MYRRSILHNTALLTAAGLAMRLVTLLYQAYLSGILGAAGMGKLQLALTAGGFAVTLGISGARVAAMNLTAARNALGDGGGVKKALYACLGYSAAFSCGAGLLLCLLSGKLCRDFVHAPELAPALILLGATIPAASLSAVLDGYFTALGRIRTLVRVELAEQLGSIPVTLLLLRFSAPTLAGRCCAVIAGSGICAFLRLAVLLLFSRRTLRAIREPAREPVLTPMLKLCVPLALGDYLRAGLSTLEQFLIPRGLRRFSGSGEAALAEYGTVGAMVFPVLMFPAALFSALSDLLVPELSRLLVCGKQVGIRRIATRSLRFGAVFSAMIAGLMFLLGPFLGRAIYRSETAGADLRLFAPLVLILYLDALTDGMLKGLGQQLAGVRYNTLTSALDVLLLLLLLPRLGFPGYWISFAVTHGLNFALSFHRLRTVTGISSQLCQWIPAALCAALSAAGALFWIPPEGVGTALLSTGLYLLLYCILIPTLGVLRPGELRLFYDFTDG